MKQIRRRAPSALYTVPFLLFLYLLLTTASYVLASSSFPGVFSGESFTSPRGILILVLLPTGLLVFLSIFFWLQVSESLHNGDGSRTGNRLFLAFCLLVAASSFPQSLVSARYISSALDSWFDLSVSRTYADSESIAALYSESRLRLANRGADQYLTGLSISNYRSRPVDWMPLIRAIDPDAVSCQVYLLPGDEAPADESAKTIVESGDSAHFLERSRLDQIAHGPLDLEGDEDLLRVGRIIRYSGQTYSCVYTTVLPKGFQDLRERIAEGGDRAVIIDALKPFLPLMGMWIYFLFSLPPLLILVSLCWLLSRRFSDPARALSEAADRLSAGDSSWRVVASTRDDFGRAAARMNHLAETREHSRKPGDKRAVLKL